MPTKTKTGERAPRRTEAEIAQEKLDFATGKLNDKIAKVTRLEAELAETKESRDDWQAKVDYLAANPVLIKAQKALEALKGQLTDEPPQ